MSKSKLIVIEGLDGSGKQTQFDILYKNIEKTGKKVVKISFPDYDSETSIFVRKYLAGEFGKSADSVNPYTASSFFALDRYAVYTNKWNKYIDEGYIILADRYVTSNMIFQCAKIDINDTTEKNKFLDWLWDFEYCKLELPTPDLVLFFDVPVEICWNSILKRKEEKTSFKSGDAEDIHENDKLYLERVYDSTKFIADKYNWENIKCFEDKKMRTREAIAKDIFTIVQSLLNEV